MNQTATILNMNNKQDIRDQFIRENSNAYRYYRGEFYFYDRTHYITLDKDEMFSKVCEWLDTCRMVERKTGELINMRYDPKQARDIMDLLRAKLLEPSLVDLPVWCDTKMNADSVIPFNNGLYDVDAGIFSEHTPNYFSTFSIPHNYDETAQCPLWIKTLNEIFEGDEERIRALQIFMGYLLTSDMSLQKALFFIGETRTGKSTVSYVIEQMIGEHNICSPSLKSLGETFGLQSLIDKKLAIVPDAHLAGKEGVPVLEKLKQITGCDAIDINRKGLPYLTNVRLKTRFIITANKMPRFSDSSNAITNRFIVIPFENGFEGRENFSLRDELKEEIAGITNWAIEGLGIWKWERTFVQPKAGLPYIEILTQLASPTKAFLDENCVIGEDKFVKCTDLYKRFCEWNKSEGHHDCSHAEFRAKMQSLYGKIVRTKKRVNGKPENVYLGIALAEDGEPTF